MAILSSPLQLILSTPPATRFFTAFLILSSGIYHWLQWRAGVHTSMPYFLLVPGISWMYPWTLLTSSFVERTVIGLAFSLLALPVSLRYLERLWGTSETLKFIGVVLIVPNIVTFVVSWIEYLVSGMELFIYEMEYNGQMALQTGVLVAFTQIIPEHQVQLFGVLKMRVKRLPMVYVTLSTILCIVGYQDPWINIQFGWLVSWIYLRFYKRTSSDSGPAEYGDRSETFAFIYWFPPFLHYPISIPANAIHDFCLRIKIIPSQSSSLPDVESGGYATLPGGARAEAERRRAMALKALDQRLANPAQNPGATSLTPETRPRGNSSSTPQSQGPGANVSSVERAEPEGDADLRVSAEKD